MKNIARLMSLMLTVVMISSLICITSVYAANGDVTPTPSTGIEQSVSVDFDTLPSFLSDVATTATVDDRTVASITPEATAKKFTIDATNFAGALRKKGILTYSFEYKTSERDSSKMIPSLTLKFDNGNQLNEKGESAGAWHNHIAEFCQKVWNRGGANNLSTTDWHKVKIDVNYSTGKIWVSVDGGTPVEQANNNLGLAYGAIEHFKLAGSVIGRTDVADQYFYMDNLNITYTERGIEEKRDYAYDMTIFEDATDDSRGTVKKLAANDKFTFDVTDFAGKSSKKGKLRYSFDYKTSEAALTLKYDDYGHVGSQWDNHIAEFRNAGWNRVVNVNITPGKWHNVVVEIDFTTKLATVWVDGVTNAAAAIAGGKNTGDPRDHSGRINNFDYFQLCGTVTNGDMLIDNMKAEYTERPLYEETAIESYDDTTLEVFVGGDSEQVSGETYGVIPKTSKTSGDVWLSVDPTGLSGYTTKNGVMEFSLKYKNENHSNDYKVALYLGKHGASPVLLGYLQGASFRGEDKVTYMDGNKDASVWHDVNVKVDFVNKKAYVKFGTSDVYTHDISDAMANGTTNLCRLYTQRGYYEGKPYYVDDIKVSYTETAPATDLLTATSFAGISAETESAGVNVNADTEKIAIQFNTAIDPTTLNTANVKLTNVTGYNNSTVEPKWGLIEDVVTYTGSYDSTTNIYTITPDAAALLGKDKWFRLSLTGIKSATGIPMELGSIYTIRTGKDDMLYMVGDSTLQQKTGEADFADVTAVADVLNATAVKGSATIVNTAAAQTVKYIVAMYKGDEFADAFVKDVTVATGKNICISDAIDISEVNKTDVDKVKLFVWNGFTEMVPLGCVKTYPAE